MSVRAPTIAFHSYSWNSLVIKGKGEFKFSRFSPKKRVGGGGLEFSHKREGVGKIAGRRLGCSVKGGIAN